MGDETNEVTSEASAPGETAEASTTTATETPTTEEPAAAPTETPVATEIDSAVTTAETDASTVLTDAGNFLGIVQNEIANAKTGIASLKATAVEYDIGNLVSGTIKHFEQVIANLEAAAGVEAAKK